MVLASLLVPPAVLGSARISPPALSSAAAGEPDRAAAGQHAGATSGDATAEPTGDPAGDHAEHASEYDAEHAPGHHAEYPPEHHAEYPSTERRPAAFDARAADAATPALSPLPLSPVLYLPHGAGPLPVLGEPSQQPLVDFLERVPARLGAPDAILLISAHWEEATPTIVSRESPGLLYDYYNFPPESYTIEYPVTGDAGLASEVQSLLDAAGFESRADTGRGYDHGVFVPLKLMYPQADIPCVQVSMLKSLDPGEHIEIGRALAPLRRRNVLIVGSGLSFHNLRVLLGATADDVAGDFDAWLKDTCCNADLNESERSARLIEWTEAPGARYCHPREDHLLPLHVCFGAADGAAADVALEATFMGAPVSALLWSD